MMGEMLENLWVQWKSANLILFPMEERDSNASQQNADGG